MLFLSNLKRAACVAIVAALCGCATTGKQFRIKTEPVKYSAMELGLSLHIADIASGDSPSR
jgi:hypothetical protein